MSWSPINFRPGEQDVDRVLRIDGLADILSSTSTNQYCLLNLFHLPGQTLFLPPSYDVYILGYWHEVFHDEWFVRAYDENPHARFIILTDLRPNKVSGFDRVTWIRLIHWKLFIPRQLPVIDWNKRIYKISSLSNRCTLFRLFITALLLDKPNVLVRWHANFPNEINRDWMYSPSGHVRRDRLCRSLDRLDLPYNAEIFANDPQQSLDRSPLNPAYSSSIINCVNETKDVSCSTYLEYGPGPYLSEKTWKSIINGNALVFSGQAGMCRELESAGFRFDYPWTNCYNDLVGDLDRLEATLETVEKILDFDIQDLVIALKASVIFNQEHIISGDFARYIDQTNEQGLAHLCRALSNP